MKELFSELSNLFNFSKENRLARQEAKPDSAPEVIATDDKVDENTPADSDSQVKAVTGAVDRTMEAYDNAANADKMVANLLNQAATSSMGGSGSIRNLLSSLDGDLPGEVEATARNLALNNPRGFKSYQAQVRSAVRSYVFSVSTGRRPQSPGDLSKKLNTLNRKFG